MDTVSHKKVKPFSLQENLATTVQFVLDVADGKYVHQKSLEQTAETLKESVKDNLLVQLKLLIQTEVANEMKALREENAQLKKRLEIQEENTEALGQTLQLDGAKNWKEMNNRQDKVFDEMAAVRQECRQTVALMQAWQDKTLDKARDMMIEAVKNFQPAKVEVKSEVVMPKRKTLTEKSILYSENGLPATIVEKTTEENQ